MTITPAFAARYGFPDGGNFGGTIGPANAVLRDHTGEFVMVRLGRNPSIWTVFEEDAKVILAALDEQDARLP